MIIAEIEILRFSIAILFLFYFYRSKIYIFIWIALLNILLVISNRFVDKVLHVKMIISVYVLLVIFVYLYKYRKILFGDTKYVAEYKLSSKRVYNSKMIIPFVIWLAFTTFVKILYKYVLR